MKPIIFSTPMVQAILDGRKTMTRRVIKSVSADSKFESFGYCDSTHDELARFVLPDGSDMFIPPKCVTGDILWVRETWTRDDHDGFVDFKADFSDDDLKAFNVKWRPSIFMPYEACRIFLRVTNVEAERLQEISVQDAKDEGIKVHANGCVDGLAFGCYNGDDCVYNRCTRPIDYFSDLWDSINAKRGYGWYENPWVWVVTFERCEKPL